jgi:uncharacterized protein (TIGR02246 family)
MPEMPTAPRIERDSRMKFVYFGCFANILLFATLFVICLVFLAAIARTFDDTPPTFDESAIRAVLNDQRAAWNRQDLDGFMDGYWNDKNLTFISGDQVTQGWEATRERYVKRYKSEGKEMGQLAFSEVEVEGLNPTTALVRGKYTLRVRTSQDTGRFTLIFRKFADGWKITSDHTSAAEKK